MQESKIAITERLRQEGRWEEASKFKDAAIKRLRAEEKLSREGVKERAWELIAEEFPPIPVAETKIESVTTRVHGIGEIPASWTELLGNASIQSELKWVQANRLLVVEERSPGVTIVHLERAHSPAPSWGALSWLETSIHTYSKFVDVVARSLRDEEDEQENTRQERMAIDKIRELLAEMTEHE